MPQRDDKHDIHDIHRQQIQRGFDAPRVASLATSARLDMRDDRHEIMAASLTEVYQLIDTLDSVDMGDTPPATRYVAGWK